MALSPQERSRRMRLNMLMGMSYAAFASSKSDPAAALLGTETQGLALDFLQDTYAVRRLPPIGTQTGKAVNFITFSRTSNATVVDSDGVIKWAPHNLVLNSATPATQSITVISGAQYTVNMTGSGSVALSGAGSGTVTTGNPVTVTASTTTLTLTVSGTVSTMWAYRSDLGGMQANASGSLYNATTGSAYYGPRRDFDPATLACKGLLVEEQRTNLLVYSEQIDNAAWIKLNCTVTANAVASPDGTTDADQLTVTTAGSGLIAETATVTASATNDYYFSAFVKAGNVSVVTLNPYYVGNTENNVYFNLSTLAVVGAPYAGEYIIQAYGNGWYRVGCRIARDATATRTTIAARIWVGSRPSASVGDYVYVWGAQLEAGSFATSYIPTGAATATRAVDVASVSTLAFPYSESNGTWVAAFQTQYSGTAPSTAHLINYDGSGSKQVLYFGAGSDAIGSFDGTTILNATGDVTGSVAKSASAYTAAERAVVSNGGTVTTGSTVAGYSSASIAYLGSNSSVSLNGWVRQITYLPRRISNAELQQRTSA